MNHNDILSKIDINKSLINQKSFRELLRIDQLIDLKKINLLHITSIFEIIKYWSEKQLMNTGNEEVKITGIRLEYVIASHQESSPEKYSIEWYLKDKPVKNDLTETSDQEENQYLDLQFLQKISCRLDELSALTEDGIITSFQIIISWQQQQENLRLLAQPLNLLDNLGEAINSIRRFLASGCEIRPDEYEGELYQRWFCNGIASDWVLDDLKNKKPWRRG